MPHNRKLRWGAGVIAVLTLFAVFALAGWAGAPQFGGRTASLAPSPVTTGQDVLYTVEFPYIDNQTLTRSEIRITFPADWDWLPGDGPAADPNVCTLTNDTTLTCARGTIRSGDPPVSQAVKFRTGSPAEAKTVNAILTYFELASQGDKGRFDFVDAPAATVKVKAAGDNDVSTCAAQAGETVGTPKQGLSTANPLITTMVVPGTSALCSPVSAQEFPVRDPAVSFCPDCTTQVSVTSAPLFPIANPIKLIFDIYGKPRNWYKDGKLVQPCAGPVAMPDPCILERVGVGKNLRLTVLWSGVDPSWEGA